jgi:lysophospholipase L1-like esterase
MSLRHRLLYAAWLLLCAEAGAKLLLLTPWARARLSGDSELGWRARWVGRYLFTDRDIFYGFDDHDPTKGWVLRPGLRGEGPFRRVTVSSNSRGARGPEEPPLQRRPGRRRVVAVGDSFTFGEGVNDGDTYPRRLQDLLPDTEVVNLGVHGYGLDQILIRLREEVPRYRPDVVLLGFFLNDAQRSLLDFRDYAKPRFALEGGRLALRGSPVPRPADQLWREARRSHLFDLLTLPWERRRFAERRASEQPALMAALLDEMRRDSEALGARFAIADLPPPAEIALEAAVGPSERPLLDYAAGRPVLICRTRAALHAEWKAGAAFRLAGHYDAPTHAAVARTVARCLSEGGLLPPFGYERRE